MSARRQGPGDPGAPPPGTVTTQWGNDAPTTRKRVRARPLNDAELVEACKRYFPPDVLPLAQTRLMQLIEDARKVAAMAGKPRRGPGRPPTGIGAEVAELMAPPFNYDQVAARWQVARARHVAYDYVAREHRGWRKAQNQDPDKTPG